MRPMTFLGKMGGISRSLNESVEKQVTGRIDEHRMLQTAGAIDATSQFATPQSTQKVRTFENLGSRLRNEMNTDKQKQS